MDIRRSIKTNIWSDEWVFGLSDAERCVFLYLLTSPNSNISGAFKTQGALIIGRDLGRPKDEIEAILTKFQDDGKLILRDGWLVMTNWIKHQSWNPSMKKGAIASVAQAPNWVKEYVFKMIQELESPVTDSPHPVTDSPHPVGKGKGKGKRKRKEEKEIKNEIVPISGKVESSKSKKAIGLEPSDAQEIFEYWQSVANHPKAVFDPKRKSLIEKTLKAYSVSELKECLDGWRLSAYHQGQNDRGKKYSAISLIFRDADHIEGFIENARLNKTGSNIKPFRSGPPPDEDIFPEPRPISFAEYVEMAPECEPEAASMTPEEIFERVREAYLQRNPGEQYIAEVQNYEREFRPRKGSGEA